MPSDEPRIPRVLDAVWRIEGARITAAIAAHTGDVVLAEDVAQEAVLEALRSWPVSGVPDNPAAWLTTVAKRRAIDEWRRRARVDDGEDLESRLAGAAGSTHAVAAPEEAWEPIDDDVLRLVFTACHPALTRDAQVALTLRVVGGLSTVEIARMLLTSVPTVQARITRAKATIRDAHVPFETPGREEWTQRLSGVLAVVYLVFTEGYAATAGDRWVRPELADEALRLGRIVVGLLPREPEALGLLALMEFQRARFAARESGGVPVLLTDQDRSRWDHGQIARASGLLRRADAAAAARRRAPGPYAIQAGIAECHATATSVDTTDWGRIVERYDALRRIAPSPVVELSRAAAVAMASGPAAALPLVDALEDQLRDSHLVPAVRGALLARLGRRAEARSALLIAASRTANGARRRDLLDRAAALE